MLFSLQMDLQQPIYLKKLLISSLIKFHKNELKYILILTHSHLHVRTFAHRHTCKHRLYEQFHIRKVACRLYSRIEAMHGL